MSTLLLTITTGVAGFVLLCVSLCLRTLLVKNIEKRPRQFPPRHLYASLFVFCGSMACFYFYFRELTGFVRWSSLLQAVEVGQVLTVVSGLFSLVLALLLKAWEVFRRHPRQGK